MDDFTRHYIVAALWSSTDNSRDDGGDPLDRNYDASDLAPEALEKITADCQRFQKEHAVLLSAAYDRAGYGDATQAGHDFWLTRNGHGVGFWDRDALDEGGLGESLTKASEAFGECDIYVGDDGKLYV